MLDPAAFEACFLEWIAELATASAGRLVAIDGKTIRRSLDAANGKAAIHMVSAWCEANHMVLGQVATDAKSNEITAIPKLLKLLDVRDAVVTIDAAGCQKKIAKQIVEQGGDYMLQLKGNQGGLHGETVALFEQCIRDDCYGIRYTTAETINGGHGRIEQRRIWATSEIGWFAERAKWKGLRSLIRVEADADGRRGDLPRVPVLHQQPAGRRPGEAAGLHPGSLERGEQPALVPGRQLRRRRPSDPHGPRSGELRPPEPDRAEPAEGREDAQGGHQAKRLCGWNHDYLLNVLTGPTKKD